MLVKSARMTGMPEQTVFVSDALVRSVEEALDLPEVPSLGELKGTSSKREGLNVSWHIEEFTPEGAKVRVFLCVEGSNWPMSYSRPPFGERVVPHEFDLRVWEFPPNPFSEESIILYSTTEEEEREGKKLLLPYFQRAVELLGGEEAPRMIEVKSLGREGDFAFVWTFQTAKDRERFGGFRGLKHCVKLTSPTTVQVKYPGIGGEIPFLQDLTKARQLGFVVEFDASKLE